jgi:hypothetical protein
MNGMTEKAGGIFNGINKIKMISKAETYPNPLNHINPIKTPLPQFRSFR